MVTFNLSYENNISLEQRVVFEVAARILGTFLTDETTVDIHIVGTSGLNGGTAVGGAVPIFHKVSYGVLTEYLTQDASSFIDEQGVLHLQDGNTVDLSAYGEVVDGNTEILLTTAQAEALGMDEALLLANGTTWDRDVVDTVGLDGYILINQDFDWNTDVLRTGEAAEGSLDALSMALHEMLHIMGFVSGIDGTIAFNELFSGETQVEGATLLDLFRFSAESSSIENPDGSVSTITEGEDAYLSADGGATNLGDFATGQGGDGYQASHWKRMQVALGIMDPTLAFQERLSIAKRDLQALDLLGWDVNYGALEAGLNIEALLLEAERSVAESLGLDSAVLTEHREAGDVYTMGFSEWWALFEDQIIEMGFSEWWQVLEVGYEEWTRQQADPDALLQMGFSEWWQSFEATIIEMGFSEWWQTFENNMLNMGFSEWWQVLEMGFSEWWQQLETYFSVLEKTEGAPLENRLVADGGVGGERTQIFYGGEHDDIIAGDKKQDRIKAGAGDDLIDGKAGHDVIWGESGRDMIYGHHGNDLLYGGEDDDLLLGEAGDDKLHGEAGDDIASGGRGDDIVTGGEGKDDLKGGWGRDVLDGGDGNDRLEGEADNDIVIGGEGRDQVNGGGGNDLLYGDNYLGEETLKQLRRLLKQQPADNSQSANNSQFQNTTSSEANSNPSPNPIRVEAEDMALTGNYAILDGWWSENGSGNVLRTEGTVTGTTTFNGAAGTYMVVARYFDANNADNQSLDFKLNGNPLSQLILDENNEQFNTQTVVQSVTLNPGDVWTFTASGNNNSQVLLDYLEFVSLDSLIVTELEATTESTTTSTTADDNVLRIEAESMTLLGDYQVETSGFEFASGGSVIGVDSIGEGKALTTFNGETGFYNIVVGYHDENNGELAELSTRLNGVEFDSWQLDQNLGNRYANPDNFVTRTVASGITLSQGDVFEINGLSGFDGELERARVDYVEFVKVDAPRLESQPLTATQISVDASNDQIVTIFESSFESAISNSAFFQNATSDNLFDGWASSDDYIEVHASDSADGDYHIELNEDPLNYYQDTRQIYREVDTTDGNLYTLTFQYAPRTGYSSDVTAMEVRLNGETVLALAEDGSNDANLNWKTYTVTFEGDGTSKTLEFVSTGQALNYGRGARLDDIKLVETLLINNDLIQGGEGDDIAFGGDGNDVIYGETQQDNSSAVLTGSHTYMGHTYLLSNVGTWDEAQAEARRLGGNLVTINDAEEEVWIRETFSDTERLWMGFSDAAVEGQWEWVSGESVTYTNWAPGEPNNSGNQDYGTINLVNQWDDVGNNGADQWNGTEWIWLDGLRGIIEINHTNNDTLFGDNGNDNIFGQAGNDALYGDTLAAALSEGLMLHWGFDEGSGTYTGDASGNNNTGRLWGNTSWTDGLIGNAIDFSGFDAGVSVIDSPELDLTHQFTLSTWVKVDQFNEWGGLITKGVENNVYSLQIMSTGKLQLDIRSGQDYLSWNSDAQLTTGQWHHVAVTYDGEAIRFYIDGQQDSNVAYVDLDISNNNEDLVIGAQLPGGDEYLDGAIDDVRIYNRALSHVEMAALAGGDVGGAYSVQLADGATADLSLVNGVQADIHTGVLDFDGTDDYAEIAGLETGGAMTFSAWVNYNSFNLWSRIFDFGDGGASDNILLANQWDTNTLKFQVYDGSSFAGEVSVDDFWQEDTWTHVTATIDESGLMRVYKDGELAGESTATALPKVKVRANNYIGKSNWSDEAFDGQLDSITVLAEALSKTAVADLYDNALADKQVDGNDTLSGGGSNDQLVGGIGSDVLDGSDAIAAGYLERDTVLGGGGADTFIVGSATQAYYLGAGNDDYVLIKDFNAAEDTVQLHGSAGSYQVQQQDGDLHLSYGGELIAIFENTTTLDLNSASVSYV